NRGLLKVGPVGTNGNGGSIRLITSVDFGSVKSVDLVSAGTINVSGVGIGSGGSIAILGGTLQLPSTGPVTLVANGGTEGNGGNIQGYIRSTDLALGSGAGNLILSATGGSAGSASGNGGSVNVSTEFNSVTVDLASLNVAPLGTNGNGGQIFISANSSVYLSNGNLIDTSGVGDGSGGR